MSIRKAAKSHHVPKSTLQRRLAGKVEELSPASRPPVFNREQESELVGHILDMEARGFGLTIQDICKLSFDLAEQLTLKHMFNTNKRKAGYDWYEGFMKRHPQLAIRKPEGLSAARATMLNKNVVSRYFNLLGDTMERLKVTEKGAQIYNVDETGMNTVHQPSKIIGQKGKKSIHVKTSADRGENVTAVICMSASGHFIPPMIIFKGQRLNKGLISNAPADTLFATSKSSFIDTELFRHWFSNHFLKHLPPARPVLLVLDGHASHLSLPMLLLAKENNVEILCLPPHTTSELQPLDKCFFKPLKTEYNTTCMKFLKENPGQVITRYEFCALFKNAYYKVCSMSNAISAFRATGIHPLNPGILSDDVYAPSTTSELHSTDTILSQEAVAAGQEETTSHQLPKPITVQPLPSTSRTMETAAEAVKTSTSDSRTLGDLLNVPTVVKVAADASNKKSRRVTSARCVTEEGFMKELEEKERIQEEKRLEKENRQKERESRALQKKQNARSCKRKSTEQHKLKCNDKAVDDPENYCTHCNGYYFDDDSDDEDWVKCKFEMCRSWYHESCTGAFGKSLSQFLCNKHST